MAVIAPRHWLLNGGFLVCIVNVDLTLSFSDNISNTALVCGGGSQSRVYILENDCYNCFSFQLHVL